MELQINSQTENLKLYFIIPKFDDISGVILVNGKTGTRRVRAGWSVDYLKEWLEEHPGQNDPEAPMWFNFAKKGKALELMRYEAIRRLWSKI